MRALVFDSADPDYYISHLDVERFAEVPDIPGAASLTDQWHHFVTELAHSPVISIASIRGRARGIGIEFVHACDMRFASREKAILAQPEVGFGVTGLLAVSPPMPRARRSCPAPPCLNGPLE